MLWVDKYSPRRFSALDLHADITKRLQKIAQSSDFPHLIFTGPNGAGKRTRVSCLISEIYNPSEIHNPIKMQLEHKTVDVSDSKSIDVAVLASPYHTEINLGELGTQDRAVVVTLIKEMTQTAPLTTFNAKADPIRSGPSNSKRPCVPFKIIVLHEVDRISRGAQQALRRTMEKCMATCRLILVAESTGQLIGPLLSRCLEIRVPSPTDAEIVRIMHHTLELEGEDPSNLRPSTKDEILRYARGNLRRAMLVLETAWRNEGTFERPEWRTTISRIGSMILQEQTPRQLHEVRGVFYTLLTHCIPPSIIQQCLLEDLSSLIQEKYPSKANHIVLKMVQHAATYNHTQSRGSRPIFHLEAFVAEVMSLIKTNS